MACSVWWRAESRIDVRDMQMHHYDRFNTGRLSEELNVDPAPLSDDGLSLMHVTIKYSDTYSGRVNRRVGETMHAAVERYV